MKSKALIMIRPRCFGYNSQTSSSNSFQNKIEFRNEDIQAKALVEFDSAVEKLQAKGIEVIVFEDTPSPTKPDAIFPNNWFSVHENHVILYPMMAENRRLERRMDIIDTILGNRNLIDLSTSERDGKFLEGTGSIVFDHDIKMAFAALSLRTNLEILEKLCATIGYKWFAFNTKNHIYHTNVVMSIGSKYSLICFNELDSTDSKKLKAHLNPNKNIIEIPQEQVALFCGNVLEVQNKKGEEFIVMSETAYNAFNPSQLEAFEKEPLVVSIPTIETVGGGGIRCMLAEIF